MSDSLRPHGLCSPWNSPGQHTGVGNCSLLLGLEWVTVLFSWGFSQPRDWTQVSCIAGRFFTSWATREAQEYWSGRSVPSVVDLPDPGVIPGSPAWQADSLPTKVKKVLLITTHWQLTLNSAIVSCSVMSNSYLPHELSPTKLLCLWNSPGKKTGVPISFSRGSSQPRDQTHLSSITSHQGGPKFIIHVSVLENVNIF